MSNQKNVENQNKQVQQVQQTPANAEPQQNMQQVQQQTEQQQTFGQKLKSHWKGVTAAVLGGAAAVTSAVLAYRKGKAAGAACAPMPQQQEDYSLNPNED